MKNVALSCIIFLNFICSQAQNNTLEELMNGINMLESYKKEYAWQRLVEDTFKENNLKLDFKLDNLREVNLKLLDLYQEVITSFPQSEFYPQALFYSAQLHVTFGDVKLANQLYTQFIEPINNGVFFDLKKEREAHNFVGSYYYSLGEYEKALSFLIINKRKGVDIRTSDYCIDNNDLETIEIMSLVYFALKDEQNALKTMLEPVLLQRCNGFKRYFLFVQDELLKRFSRKFLKDEWMKALNHIQKRKGLYGVENFIVFLGVKISLPYLGDLIGPDHIISVLERIQNSEFHQWIENL